MKKMQTDEFLYALKPVMQIINKLFASKFSYKAKMYGLHIKFANRGLANRKFRGY
jgi:hypothetical protein